jgi:U4/U6.U5 tri-snRNP-associated protein 3
LMLVCRNRSNAFQDGGREGRDRPRERSRSRDRRDTRSRSPRRERERDVKRDVEPEKAKILKPDEELTKSRTATPPVSFKVTATGQDHDRMEVDGETGRSKKNKGKKGKVEDEPEDDEDIVVDDDGMAAMQAMMGFGGFATTHQQKVAGNDIYAVRKEKKTEYRQYMNRVGGFNRPLSPTRE